MRLILPKTADLFHQSVLFFLLSRNCLPVLLLLNQKKMNKNTNTPETALVTGGSGYLASWIVRDLLEEGHLVHTTIRSKSDQDKYEHLVALSDQYPGKLKFFEADLLKSGSFDEAVAGCSVVVHAASPFKIMGVKDPEKELVQPAVEGVRNLFGSIRKTGKVRRVVLTSSIAAIYGNAIESENIEGGIFNEQHWNGTSSLTDLPYSYSKTLAEKEAWMLAGGLNGTDLVVINPGLILGPSLSRRTDSTSVKLMRQLTSGLFRLGVPRGTQAVVDVRDVARAHVKAAFTPQASGRYIVAPHSRDFLDFARVIHARYPQLPLPSGYMPNWVFYIVGPLAGYSPSFIRKNFGYDLRFDNSRTTRELGIHFRPWKDTLLDHVEQLRNDGLFK